MGKRELEVCIVSKFNMCADDDGVCCIAGRPFGRLLKTQRIIAVLSTEKCAFDIFNIALISYGRFRLIYDNFEKSTKRNFIILRSTKKRKKKYAEKLLAWTENDAARSLLFECIDNCAECDRASNQINCK